MSKRLVYIILRNDDPCALSDVSHERRLLSLLEQHGVPHVAAVIPRVVDDPHDERDAGAKPHPLEENPDMVALLKEYRAKGLLEIAQHGDTHQTNPFRPSATHDRDPQRAFAGIANPWLPFDPAHPDGYSEFAGLPAAEQREKILGGKAYLEKLLGTEISTFIFPWNTYDKQSLKVLREAGFDCALVGDEAYPMPGLLVVGCCSWGVDEFIGIVESALAQGIPALVHLSFHSWMLGDEEFAHLQSLLNKFADHEAVRFILPSQVPELPYRVSAFIWLRTISSRLTTAVYKHVRTFYPTDPGCYLFSVPFYLQRIQFYGTACLVLKTLGLSKMLALLTVVAAGMAYLLVSTFTREAVLPLLSGIVLLITLLLWQKAAVLMAMRRRQRRLERIG